MNPSRFKRLIIIIIEMNNHIIITNQNTCNFMAFNKDEEMLTLHLIFALIFIFIFVMLSYVILFVSHFVV